MGWDRELESWIVAHRVELLNTPFRWLTYAGTQGAVWLVLALALALARRRVQVLLLVLVADLAADGSAAGLQVLFGRARPVVSALVSRPHSHSFPSGHATTSFACATVLGALVPAARIPAYLLAATIAFSRLYVGVHYPVDVVGGAALGTAVGLLVLRLAPSVSERFSLWSGTPRSRER